MAEPKTRKRKSPKHRAESITAKALNAIDALACMAERLNPAQRDAVRDAVSKKLAELGETFDSVGADAEEPEAFSLPD